MNKIIDCFKQAAPVSWKSTKWLLKLMIPISLAVTLMQHFGVLAWIATWINPLFVHFGLPGESAVAFISGATAGTYAGIAAMMSIPLTMKQASILALMIALYIAQDSFGTACNVTGDGAIAVLIDTWKKKSSAKKAA